MAARVVMVLRVVMAAVVATAAIADCCRCGVRAGPVVLAVPAVRVPMVMTVSWVRTVCRDTTVGSAGLAAGAEMVGSFWAARALVALVEPAVMAVMVVMVAAGRRRRCPVATVVTVATVRLVGVVGPAVGVVRLVRRSFLGRRLRVVRAEQVVPVVRRVTPVMGVLVPLVVRVSLAGKAVTVVSGVAQVRAAWVVQPEVAAALAVRVALVVRGLVVMAVMVVRGGIPMMCS